MFNTIGMLKHADSVLERIDIPFLVSSQNKTDRLLIVKKMQNILDDMSYILFFIAHIILKVQTKF